jgi:hypothetical protein
LEGWQQMANNEKADEPCEPAYEQDGLLMNTGYADSVTPYFD